MHLMGLLVSVLGCFGEGHRFFIALNEIISWSSVAGEKREDRFSQCNDQALPIVLLPNLDSFKEAQKCESALCFVILAASAQIKLFIM